MDQPTVVDVAGALASASRLRILALLKEPLQNFTSVRPGDLSDDGGVCVSLLAVKLEQSQPTTSRHLEILRRVGMITTSRVAQWNFHYRDDAGIARALQVLSSV